MRLKMSKNTEMIYLKKKVQLLEAELSRLILVLQTLKVIELIHDPRSNTYSYKVDKDNADL